MIVKDTVFGADASSANSFLPYIQMISSLTGAGGGAAKAPNASASGVDTQTMQMQLASMKKTQTYLMYGALGVGALGILYLLLKR